MARSGCDCTVAQHSGVKAVFYSLENKAARLIVLSHITTISIADARHLLIPCSSNDFYRQGTRLESWDYRSIEFFLCVARRH